MSSIQRLMAHAFAGIAFAFLGAALGGSIGWSLAVFDNKNLDAYLLHVPGALTKAQGTLAGGFAGAALGFPLGVLANMRWQARWDRSRSLLENGGEFPPSVADEGTAPPSGE